MLLHQRIRVFPSRQKSKTPFAFIVEVAENRFKRFFRRFFSRLITVKSKHDLVGTLAKLGNVGIANRRAKRGDRFIHAVLRELDYIHIAFRNQQFFATLLALDSLVQAV